MRYQLPKGVSGISAGGSAFTADSDGAITVPDDASPKVHAELQNPMLFGLKLAENQAPPAPPPVPDSPLVAFLKEVAAASVKGDTGAQKKLIREFLTEQNVPHDGRGTLPYLQQTAAPIVEKLVALEREAAGLTEVETDINEAEAAGAKAAEANGDAEAAAAAALAAATGGTAAETSAPASGAASTEAAVAGASSEAPAAGGAANGAA